MPLVAASRFNAVTQGIFRDVELLDGADKAQFAALIEDHAPDGAQAALWVRELAVHEWRLGLCLAPEGALLAPRRDGGRDVGRDVGDTCFEIDHWAHMWVGKATAVALREWLKAVRWSDRELHFRVARGV